MLCKCTAGPCSVKRAQPTIRERAPYYTTGVSRVCALHERVRGSGGTAPFILNFDIRRSMEKLMLQRLYSHVNILRSPQQTLILQREETYFVFHGIETPIPRLSGL
jgi:hypothetical protein